MIFHENEISLWLLTMKLPPYPGSKVVPNVATCCRLHYHHLHSLESELLPSKRSLSLSESYDQKDAARGKRDKDVRAP